MTEFYPADRVDNLVEGVRSVIGMTLGDARRPHERIKEIREELRRVMREFGKEEER